MKYFVLFPVFFFSGLLIAQNSKQLDELANTAAYESFDELYKLLSIPNDAFYPEDIEKNVKWCEAAFGNRGFHTTRIETETVPLLLAKRTHKKAKKTVLIYLQIDGQPVDSTRWFQESPYKPSLKKKDSEGKWEIVPWDNIKNYKDDWRVFARSASDAKGPVAMFLAALDAAAHKKIVPNYNIKVIMDFEEELGSPQLPKAVKKNAELLEADMLIIYDGPRHITNRPYVDFRCPWYCDNDIDYLRPRSSTT